MEAGFLARIARHPLRMGRDGSRRPPAEIFAAVIAHPQCDEAARFIVCGWLERALEANGSARPRLEGLLSALRRADPCRLEVRTQFHTTAGGRRRRPDLQLVFRTPVGDVTIWVEVKHGTAPHSGQLADYLRAQDERGMRRGAVVLVAPRRRLLVVPGCRDSWRGSAIDVATQRNLAEAVCAVRAGRRIPH